MAKKNIANEVASAVGSAAGSAAARVEGLKTKRSTTTKHSKAKVVAAEEEIPSAAPVAIDPNEIAQLAYLYWEARGGQNGSPEEDWILAERELIARSSR